MKPPSSTERTNLPVDPAQRGAVRRGPRGGGEGGAGGRARARRERRAAGTEQCAAGARKLSAATWKEAAFRIPHPRRSLRLPFDRVDEIAALRPPRRARERREPATPWSKVASSRPRPHDRRLDAELHFRVQNFVGRCQNSGIDAAAVDGCRGLRRVEVAPRAIGADHAILSVPLDHRSRSLSSARTSRRTRRASSRRSRRRTRSRSQCSSRRRRPRAVALTATNAVGAWGWRAAEWEAVAWCTRRPSCTPPVARRRRRTTIKSCRRLARFRVLDVDRFEWALSMVSSRAAANVLSDDRRDRSDGRHDEPLRDAVGVLADAAARAIVVKAYVAWERAPPSRSATARRRTPSYSRRTARARAQPGRHGERAG